jgi:hypothetical protein
MTEDEVVEYAIGMACDGTLVQYEGRLDWEDTLYRIEVWTGYDLGTDSESKLIKRIKREVRKALKD